MLLMDFVTQLHRQHPHLATRLTLTDLTQLLHLASAVYIRSDKVFQFTSCDYRIIPFLELALKLQLDTSDYEVLWTLTFPSLPFVHLDSTALIRTYGLDDSLKKKTQVHEVYLTPPTSVCLVCHQPKHPSLSKRPRIQGYLYDLDGIHSAEFHTWACLGMSHLDFGIFGHSVMMIHG